MNRTTTRSLTLVLALFLAAPAWADGPFDTQQASALASARALETTGIVMTVLGVAAEATTLVLWGIVATHACGFDYPCLDGEGPPGKTLPAAWVTTALAPALLGGGITMWSVGAHREKKLRAGVSISPGGGVRF